GYVIEHFPEFQREHPRLSKKFADTVERTYSACSWMPDERFQDAISAAAYAGPVVQAFRRSWCIDSGLVVHAFR
ncbi:MAG: hypothetical protein J6J12_07565, partial [Oscillospiraceae bacterium]|nr:hypothetical protein [Oscillospiraceae bacterium]